MSTRLKIKGILLVLAVLISVAGMGLTLVSMQDDLSIESAQADIQREMEELPALLEEADVETAQNSETFDAIYQSKAESVAFMANHDTGFAATNAKMSEYKNLLGVDNVLIVDRDGGVVARAQDTLADFTYQRYNQLRTVFDTDEPSASMEVEFADEGVTMRYYAARIDDDSMAVIEQNPAELDELVANTGSLSSVLSGVSVGQNGYVFAVSAKNYVVEYHPNAAFIGTDALDDGIEVERLEDGTFTWITFGGERLYCGISEIGDSYYLSAIPESDMTASRNLTVGVILFIFFSVAMVVALYGFFVMREDEKRGYNPENYLSMGPLRFNKAIGKKAIVLSFVGFLAVMLVTFYMQTLFSLSSESVSSNERAADIERTIDRTNAQADTLTEQYNERYLSKAEVAAYALEQNADLKNRDDLQLLADTLQVEYLYVFNSEGVLIATNSPYSNFTLSEDPEDQSYAFRALLQGVEYIVQEPMPEEVSGELRQYIGVTLRNAQGEADGFVQLSMRPERLETLLSSVQIDTILDGVKLGQGGFAFAVNKADGTFAYYPDEKLQGTSATSAGLEESQLKGGFSDFLTVGGVRYYASSFETDDCYVYVAQPESELMTDRVPLTLATGANGIICQIVIFLLVTFEIRRKQGEVVAAGEEADDDEPNRTFETTMPSGRRAKTESAASRWIYRSMHWGDKSAEQRVLTVLKVLTGIFAIAVCVAVVFQDRVFPKDSVFSYVLSGNWEYGLNVFAVTAALMIACVVLTITMMIQALLRMLSDVFGARGETMCRLVSSFIKYASIIGMVYYCLMLIGIDTTTLLASAGILSIAISFGAKELVSDILSGLFIIFEGDFRVGDIIQVGSKTGTVVEIGVRTTKINDGNGNIIIIRNSEVSDVVNMTKELSYATCDMDIEYGESLERAENILETEFPNIRRRLPAILDGPFYKGVVSLDDNTVTIRMVVQCAESSRGQLERDLRREMKLIFDEYEINIPLSQVVVRQPREFYKATLAEQLRADRFNDEQKEAAKDMGNEEYEADDSRK
ncbi:mechanosensitive ion channel domain-containing protein [uncultured Slackia sp.]|uniref:mechanosensitive ion channel domain-containing protein n=1 Tax=uncultured Slackia sp. TaxID=665903 RepID=UPI0025F2F829|nr:cache domain-containing protein [uncultured Slackia sp.]